MDKLLIVDDEEAVRRLMRIHLSDTYEIIDTGSPDQALALAMHDKPNAIVLDLRMPKYSGFELCQTLHALTATQLIPLIIVSGEAGDATKSLCKELGAAAYFEKPIDFDALRKGLAGVLQRVQPERRIEPRIRLRVALKLRGTDVKGVPFVESTTTANVSRNGFLTGCTAALKLGSTVTVEMSDPEAKFSGQARVVRCEGAGDIYPRYAFRITHKTGEWILK
jgi:twitching motility two-component system response regulator PilG